MVELGCWVKGWLVLRVLYLLELLLLKIMIFKRLKLAPSIHVWLENSCKSWHWGCSLLALYSMSELIVSTCRWLWSSNLRGRGTSSDIWDHWYLCTTISSYFRLNQLIIKLVSIGNRLLQKWMILMRITLPLKFLFLHVSFFFFRKRCDSVKINGVILPKFRIMNHLLWHLVD